MTDLGELKRRIVLGLLLALLAWQAGPALVAAIGTSTRDQPAWSLRLSDDDDERVRAAFGEDYGAYRAVLDHVPEGVPVILAASRDVDRLLVANNLIHTLFPRPLLHQAVAAQFAAERSLGLDDPCFLLDLAPGIAKYPPSLREVARGHGFVLYETRIGR